MPSVQAAVSPFSQLIPLVIIFFIFYFLVIKPQKVKQKEQENLRKNVKKNDRVVTAGGMHGTVVMVKDKTVMIRVDDNVKIEIDRESISTVEKKKS